MEWPCLHKVFKLCDELSTATCVALHGLFEHPGGWGATDAKVMGRVHGRDSDLGQYLGKARPIAEVCQSSSDDLVMEGRKAQPAQSGSARIPAMEDLPADTRTFSRTVVAVIQGDITQVAADAIVNAANNAFAHGGGVDGAIRKAAGPELSGEMRRRYPAGTPTGTAVATGAYALPAQWVIHAVGPVRGFGGQDKLDLLGSAYRSALLVADDLGAKTISSPAISAGTFGFPVETAADVALRTVRDHVLGETGIERVTFVLRQGAFETFKRRLAEI